MSSSLGSAVGSPATRSCAQSSGDRFPDRRAGGVQAALELVEVLRSPRNHGGGIGLVLAVPLVQQVESRAVGGRRVVRGEAPLKELPRVGRRVNAKPPRLALQAD